MYSSIVLIARVKLWSPKCIRLVFFIELEKCLWNILLWYCYYYNCYLLNIMPPLPIRKEEGMRRWLRNILTILYPYVISSLNSSTWQVYVQEIIEAASQYVLLKNVTFITLCTVMLRSILKNYLVVLWVPRMTRWLYFLDQANSPYNNSV